MCRNHTDRDSPSEGHTSKALIAAQKHPDTKAHRNRTTPIYNHIETGLQKQAKVYIYNEKQSPGLRKHEEHALSVSAYM